MDTHVEFRSSHFPPDPGEEDEVNPGRFGRKLAEFIASALNTAELEAAPPSPEDWGWVVHVHNPEFPLSVGCGNYEYPDGFLCFIEPHQPFRRRWFRKIHVAPKVELVRSAIDAALRSHPGVRDIRWSSYEQFHHPTLPK